MNHAESLMSKLAPSNQMIADMASEHRKIIHGAVYHAIREITGRDHKEYSDEDMVLNLGIETPEDSMEWVAYHWKGREIIRVFAPQVVHRKGRTIVHQRILEVWKKDPLRGTPGQKLDLVAVPN